MSLEDDFGNEVEIGNGLWAVVRLGANVKQFKVFHVYEEYAKAEAERLCRKEKAEFYVLKVIGKVKPQETPVVWEEL